MTGRPPSWEHLVYWLVGAVVVLELAASVLPRLVMPVVILAAVFVAVRLVLFHTRKW